MSDVVAQLRTLGIRDGDVLLVHISFRAVRPIERGPDGLIEALCRAAAPLGTVVMPSWTGEDDRPFDPRRTPTPPDLGIVASTFWQMPGVLRSGHPFAFAARGPKAEEILADDLVLPPHQPASPVGRVLDLDGRILLLGVDHDANTTLHLAELMAGVPYGVPKHITALRDGMPTRLDYRENDHCCDLFRLADGWMAGRGLQTEGLVGRAPSKLMRSRDLVEEALAQLKRDPLIFLHSSDAGCEDCAMARTSIAA